MPTYRIPCTIEIPAEFIVTAKSRKEAITLAKNFEANFMGPGLVDNPDLSNWSNLKIQEGG